MQNYFKLPQHLSVNLLNSLANKAKTHTHLFGDVAFIAKVSNEEALIKLNIDDGRTVSVIANYDVDAYTGRLTSFSVHQDDSNCVAEIHRVDSPPAVYKDLVKEITKCIGEESFERSLTGNIIALTNAIYGRYSDQCNTVLSRHYKTLHVVSSMGFSNMFEFTVVADNFFFTDTIGKDKEAWTLFSLEDLLNVLAYNFIENSWSYEQVRYELSLFYHRLRFYFSNQENINGLDASAFFEKLDAYVEEEEKEINNASSNE